MKCFPYVIGFYAQLFYIVNNEFIIILIRTELHKVTQASILVLGKGDTVSYLRMKSVLQYVLQQTWRL